MTSFWHVARAAGRIGAFGLGAVCLAAALAGDFGWLNGWLDIPNHFAPLWLLGALSVALSGALLARGATRRRIVLLGALGALAAAGLMVPEMARHVRPRVAAGGRQTLRLIQVNAWERNADPAAAAAWIAAQRPDIVAVEEVTPNLRDALIRRGFRFTKGIETVGIFSRLTPERAPFAVPMADWPRLPEFARATFAAPDGGAPFTVVAIHLAWPTLASHWGQPPVLATLLDRYPRDRLIVVGDCNRTPWSFALRGLDRRLGLERRDRALPTWPALRSWRGRNVAALALFPIDHVYAGSAWRTVGLTRGPRIGSDHYPLILDLALAD
jgi:endonuclease/exonuclease/phosphatase (EEP) superfamily protein YafD